MDAWQLVSGGVAEPSAASVAPSGHPRCGDADFSTLAASFVGVPPSSYAQKIVWITGTFVWTFPEINLSALLMQISSTMYY